MKLTKLIGMITLSAIAWHFLKNRKPETPGQGKGALSKFVDGLKEEVKKPLNKMDDDIPLPVANA